MGSINTHILKTQKDVESMLSQGLTQSLDGPIDFEVEKFITGLMYHIDGFVLKYVCGGRFFCARKKMGGKSRKRRRV